MNTRVFTPYSTIIKTSKVIRVLLSIHSLQMCVHVSVLYILVYVCSYVHALQNILDITLTLLIWTLVHKGCIALKSFIYFRHSPRYGCINV